MQVVLFQPEIPQNTGNIARSCSLTNSKLVLVRPLGFSLSDRQLKRAGLDYWDGVAIEEIDDLVAFLQNTEDPFYFFSSKVPRLYTDVVYPENAILIFGSETSGLPKQFSDLWPDRFVTLPMRKKGRSLNLSNSVAIALYEVIRQNPSIF